MVLVESFSGIRGIYGLDLTEDIIKKYARAYCRLLINKNKTLKIVIGRDTRPSGKAILDYLIESLECEIIDIGISPTPIIENAVRAFNAGGGIIITASHNEPEFNGFKFLDSDGAILRPSDIDFVINEHNKIKEIDFSKNKKEVKNMEKEAIEEYKKFLREILKTHNLVNNTKVLVDPNGGSGIISKEIFEGFDVNADYINMKMGEFKRLIEPNEASLMYLHNKIKENNCDFAIGFDCDADRIEILLEDGSLVSGNQILSLIAEEILSHSKENKSVIVNDATSYLVKEIIEKYNGKLEEVEVGEINVVDKMLEQNSLVGGEGSNGGVIISPSKCRDGILTLLVLLKLIKEKNKTLKELIEEFPKYYYLKEKVKLKEDFFKSKERLKKYYTDKGFKILETGDETGGLKALKNNSWIWFRQSKTENKLLRIIADSKNKEISDSLIKEAKLLLS